MTLSLGVQRQFRYGFCIVCIFLAAFHGCEAVLLDEKIDTSAAFYYVERFCFANGGTMQLNATVAPGGDAGQKLLLCTDSQAVKIRASIGDGKLCPTNDGNENDSEHSICEHAYSFVKGPEGVLSLGLNKPGPSGYFNFFVENCAENAYSMVLEGQFLNPGGEHLSCDTRPLPEVYRGFFIVWLITVVYIVADWAINRRREYAILFRYTAIPPQLQVIAMALMMQFWSNFSETGTRQTWLAVWQNLVFSAFKGSLFAMLIVVAKGWMIHRPGLDPQDRRTLLLTVAWLMIAMFTYRLFEGLFLFALILVYVVVLRIIFANLQHFMRAMQIQLSMLMGSNNAEAAQSIRDKIKVLRAFQIVMASYVTAQVVVRILASFMATALRAYWVYVVIEEMLDWLLFTVVFGTLRWKLWSTGLTGNAEDLLLDPFGIGESLQAHASNMQALSDVTRAPTFMRTVHGVECPPVKIEGQWYHDTMIAVCISQNKDPCKLFPDGLFVLPAQALEGNNSEAGHHSPSPSPFSSARNRRW